MNLFDEAQIILEKTGYHLEVREDPSHIFFFEDSSLFGFLAVYQTIDKLLANWHQLHDSFLQTHARQLREYPSKAWNAYSIFVTSEPCPTDKSSQLLSIEEDFRGTRKIAHAGIVTRRDLVRVLFPLLPIQHAVSLTAEDPVAKLSDRLILTKAEKSALFDNTDVFVLERSLLEDKK